MAAQQYLHITNGDSAATSLKESSIPGDVLPWRDVLHEGPVPEGLSLDALSKIRADYICGQWPVFSQEESQRDFSLRDAHLAGSERYREIILWFEHDLYDQLQLLQLLDWFAIHPRQHAALSLICIDSYPGIQPFYGLGQLSLEQLVTLFGKQTPVTADQLNLGQAGWKAFTSQDPTDITTYLASDSSSLPFMHAALIRFLEEYPSTQNGLGRTDQDILELIREGADSAGKLFWHQQQREEAPFLGDWVVWQRIADLCSGPKPLLKCEPSACFRFPPNVSADKEFLSQRFSLTKTGRSVLSEQADWLELNGIDTWFGGVHLKTGGRMWRWDRKNNELLSVPG